MDLMLGYVRKLPNIMHQLDNVAARLRLPCVGRKVANAVQHGANVAEHIERVVGPLWHVDALLGSKEAVDKAFDLLLADLS